MRRRLWLPRSHRRKPLRTLWRMHDAPRRSPESAHRTAMPRRVREDCHSGLWRAVRRHPSKSTDAIPRTIARRADVGNWQGGVVGGRRVEQHHPRVLDDVETRHRPGAASFSVWMSTLCRSRRRFLLLNGARCISALSLKFLSLRMPLVRTISCSSYQEDVGHNILACMLEFMPLHTSKR